MKSGLVFFSLIFLALIDVKCIIILVVKKVLKILYRFFILFFLIFHATTPLIIEKTCFSSKILMILCICTPTASPEAISRLFLKEKKTMTCRRAENLNFNAPNL